jgi:hypothetical protein
MAMEEEMAATRWKSVQMKRVLDVSFSDIFPLRRRAPVRRTILLVFLVLSILL